MLLQQSQECSCQKCLGHSQGSARPYRAHSLPWKDGIIISVTCLPTAL